MIFAIIIPTYEAGIALLHIGSIGLDDNFTFCNMEPAKIKEKAPKWSQEIYLMAHRFDMLSEAIITKNMCTDTCPCLDYMLDDPSNNSSYNARLDYAMNMEDKLRRFNRTNFDSEESKEKGLVPLKWTRNTYEGYKSFMDCYQHWEEMAEKDPNKYKLEEIFKIDTKAYGKDVKPFKGPMGSTYKVEKDKLKIDNPDRIDKEGSSSYLWAHRNEFSVYQLLEDDYNCSGMCYPGVFYFSNPIGEYGPPKDTCLNQFIEVARDKSKGLSIALIMTGTMSIVIFIVHFGLYYRPIPDEGSQSADNSLKFFGYLRGYGQVPERLDSEGEAPLNPNQTGGRLSDTGTG